MERNNALGVSETEACSKAHLFFRHALEERCRIFQLAHRTLSRYALEQERSALVRQALLQLPRFRYVLCVRSWALWHCSAHLLLHQ